MLFVSFVFLIEGIGKGTKGRKGKRGNVEKGGDEQVMGDTVVLFVIA